MTTNAVICELNPMHVGHKYIFDSAKEMFGEDCVNIAIMSGNFTQRCTPAIFDKYIRAEAAVKSGADIAVELPYPWCASGVEGFALGGVTVAAGLGADRLVFGSESGDEDLLYRAAQVKSSKEFREAIIRAESESRNHGSAVIFDEVMSAFGIREKLGANDKLGLEYIRYGREQGIDEFYALKRLIKLKSATELRGMIFSRGLASCREYIPSGAFELLDHSPYYTEERYNEILLNHCRLYLDKTDDDILAYASKVAKTSGDAVEFITNLPTKKYTAARLRREILHSIIGKPKDKVPPRYTVLLAANGLGRRYLSENKKNFDLPIITKPAVTDALDDIGLTQYADNLKADELYSLCIGKPADEFIKKHPHILP